MEGEGGCEGSSCEGGRGCSPGDETSSVGEREASLEELILGQIYEQIH